MEEKKTEQENIELRSDRVNDILTAIPSWTIRWGSFSILVIIIFIIGISYFIKYPDIVIGKFKLNTESLPIVIKPKIARRIDRLLVDDKEEVQEEDILVVLESTAEFQAIQIVLSDYEKFLPSIRNHNLDNVHFDKYLELGSVQNSYTNLLITINEVRLFQTYNIGGQIPINLKKELSLTKKLRDKHFANLKFKTKSLRLNRFGFQRDSILHTESIISDFEYDQSKDLLLRNEMDNNSQELRLLEINLQIEKLKQAISIGIMDSITRSQELYLKLYNSQLQFEEAMNEWKDTYLLKSPIAGTVHFSRPIDEGEFISPEAGLLTISPSQGELFAYTLLPSAGSGKIRIGQKVMLRFEGYPHNEYGTIGGVIEDISGVSQDEGYYVRIGLPDELITNFGKPIAFTQNMIGEAHIITEDTRLLERVFYQFRALVLG